jgi:hypothetical protein
VLNYLYSGEIDNDKGMSVTDLMCILRIAEEYIIKDLKDWAEISLINLLKASNFSYMMSFADKYGADKLYNYGVWFYRQYKAIIPQEALDESFHSESLLK